MIGREEILAVLNERPRLPWWNEKHVEVYNDNCKISKDNIRGGIVVWGSELFHFEWNRESQKWQ
jgi:hypothetical protein